MVKKAIAIGFAFVLLASAFVVLSIPSVVNGLQSIVSGKQNETNSISDVANSPEAKMLNSFLSGLNSAPQYSFSGTKRISGDADNAPKTVTFSCTVKGGDYAVGTVRDGHAYRQLYVDGTYTLIDDTSRTVYQGVSYIGFPDDRLTEAFAGKLTRTREEIFSGNKVNTFELYNNGIVFALYFNKRDELIRYLYFYDSHEITIDFNRFAAGNGTGVSFDVPTAYTQRGSGDFDGA